MTVYKENELLGQRRAIALIEDTIADFQIAAASCDGFPYLTDAADVFRQILIAACLAKARLRGVYEEAAAIPRRLVPTLTERRGPGELKTEEEENDV